MIIEVTDRDIRRGKKLSTDLCPVALAAIRSEAYKGCFTLPKVTYEDILINGNIYDLPPEARAFIYSFDKGFSIEPFKFELGEPINVGRSDN